MKLSPYLFPISLLTSIFPTTGAREAPEVPTREEADASIAAEMQTRQEQKADRRASLEAVPALEEWELNQGNRMIILRRVAPPARLPIEDRRLSNEESDSGEVPLFDQSEIYNLQSSFIYLTAAVYDDSYSEITWRDEDNREWTILSNVDFRYVEGVGYFEDDKYHWMTMFSVYEVDSEREERTARLGAEKGFDYTPQSIDHLLALVPPDFHSTRQAPYTAIPEYIIFAGSEREAIPAALYEAMDALHQYYHENEERLIAEYERRIVLNEAREAWHKANPPQPEDTVINFWRVK